MSVIVSSTHREGYFCYHTHQGVVRSTRDQDLVLLLDRKVGVGVGRVNVLLVHIQDLVVADRSRVTEVVHALEAHNHKPKQSKKTEN